MTERAHLHSSQDAADSKPGNQASKDQHDCFEQFRLALASPEQSKLQYPFSVDKVMPVGEHNPPVRNWEQDAQGHLLKAGMTFAAKYDTDGKLTEACFANEQYKRLSADEIERTTIVGGKLYQDKLSSADDFKVTQFKRDGERGVRITADGIADPFGHTIYKSTKHQAETRKFWIDHFVGNGVLANIKAESQRKLLID